MNEELGLIEHLTPGECYTILLCNGLEFDGMLRHKRYSLNEDRTWFTGVGPRSNAEFFVLGVDVEAVEVYER